MGENKWATDEAAREEERKNRWQEEVEVEHSALYWLGRGLLPSYVPLS